MKKYTCMIIDDEKDAINYLASLIEENCPLLKIETLATGSEEAIRKYFQKLPDLIFLDIEIDEKNGFELLSEIYREKIKPYIVFVTAFNQYAIDAFKANALDYLLKPCSPEDLKKAVQKFIDAKEKDLQYSQIKALIRGVKPKVQFNTRTGYIYLNINDILYFEADRNYTKVFTTPEKYSTLTINLAQVERKLNNNKFWRISRSHLINSDSISEVNRKQKKVILKVGEWQIVLKYTNDSFNRR